MNFDMYQSMCRAFRAASASHEYLVMGLLAEAGEVADKYAKALRDGPSLDFDTALAKELGDILWFIASIADDLDIPMSEIAQGNIDKLTSRKARNVIHGSGDDR